MRSSNGQYWVALDHVRAAAALLVFVWHFLHSNTGYPVPFEGAPDVFPLALFDEGHTGVAVFMTLSGYLFAKLLDGRAIDYPRFLWNRFIRLAPLLLIVLLAWGVVLWFAGNPPIGYVKTMIAGLLTPAWPGGAWSITVELHFYVLLPLILFFSRIDARWLLVGVAAGIALRAALFLDQGSVQNLAYSTLVGRIDQFLLGIFFFKFRDALVGRGAAVAAVLAIFSGLAWAFDAAGGFYRSASGYPSASPVWIVLPTIEGLAYAAAIAWYDSRQRVGGGWLSKTVARYGQFSYSLYLLHPFFVMATASAIHRHVVPLDNFYIALLAGITLYILSYPIGWLSYTFIERPALRYRTSYIKLPRQAELSLA